jgi:hypothetical protein
MSAKTNRRAKKSNAHRKDKPKFLLTKKTYSYDFSKLEESNPEHLMDKAVWQKGACKLVGALLMSVIGPNQLRKRVIRVAAEIGQGLPKALYAQALRTAEVILEIGKSGHFVTVESGSEGTVRFDTGVEADAHINTHDGARPASEDEVRMYLMTRAEDLKFQI